MSLPLTTVPPTRLVEQVFEYRHLVSQRDVLGRPLLSDDVERLAWLERRFAPLRDERWSGFRRRHARLPVEMPATLAYGDSANAVIIRNLGGGGLVASGTPPLAPGTVAIVKIPDPAGGKTYRFPVRVAWSHLDETGNALGMQFIALPMATARTRPPVDHAA